MNQRLLVAATVIIFMLIIGIVVGSYITNQGIPNPQASPTPQIDTSWTETANSLLQNYNFSDQVISTNDPGLYLAYLREYLFENGTLNLLFVGNGDALSEYLEDVLEQATIEKSPVEDSFLDPILSANKVVWLNYRLVVLSKSAEYDSAYFILEDNLNVELQGRIVAREQHTSNYYLLAVSK